MSALGGGGVGGSGGLKLSLLDTLRQAWADPELKSRIMFMFGMFAVFVIGVHVPVPIPGVSTTELTEKLKNIPFFQLVDTFGGGALRRVSVFALGLNPYITSSIIMQILTTAFPEWKKEMQEGGEYARKQQNKRTRLGALVLCVFQSIGFLSLMKVGLPKENLLQIEIMTTIFWTAGAMFILWLGEQISEKGIGNGVSLMIFAGIIISLPYQGQRLMDQVHRGFAHWYNVTILLALFIATTWFIVLFTSAQRRIPIQHMKRQVGSRTMGGQTSYLPIPVNTAGVIPIIFAVSLVMIPAQFASFFPQGSPAQQTIQYWAGFLQPGPSIQGLVGTLVYTAMIFFFTYFYTAIQYNVEDLSNNLKRGGSYVPGIRPGKQTKDFLDGVISRVTVAGAAFLTIVALLQYFAPSISMIPPGSVSMIGGTSLLIMVSVALETMRQIEANLLMKHYGS